MINVVLRLESSPKLCADDLNENSRNDLFWDDIAISKHFLLPISTVLSSTPESGFSDNKVDCDCKLKCFLDFPVPTSKLTVDGQVFSNFLTLLTISKKLRIMFLYRIYRTLKPSDLSKKHKQCLQCHEICIPCCLQATVLWPKKFSLDYAWNYKMKELVFEYSELENLSAWLSTLGGAFSSLGENSWAFADKAQVTSLHQMRIAHQLNNPLLMSRCRLYYAISLLQKNKLKKARKIIENEYKFAKSQTGLMDFRLSNMCLGIWAKLKYMHQQKKYSAENFLPLN